MPKFLIRKNCEYSIEIEATDSEDAKASAQKIDVKEWDQSWSTVEVGGVE